MIITLYCEQLVATLRKYMNIFSHPNVAASVSSLPMKRGQVQDAAIKLRKTARAEGLTASSVAAIAREKGSVPTPTSTTPTKNTKQNKENSPWFS